LRNEWTVNAADGTVAFGSALDRWGFTLPMLQKKGLTFTDIVNFYKDGELEKLQELLPLSDAILNMAVNHIPNPVEAQPFRLAKIWQGDLEGTMGKSMVSLDDDGPLVVCITNVIIDPQAGVVSTGRIFSGTLRKGQDVYLLIANRQYKIQQVSIYMGQYREIVDEIPSGNLVALLGLEQGRAGETLVSFEDHEGAVGFETIKYLSDPVLTVAVEPKRPTDLPRLIDAMQKLSIQDPNLVATINQETGEYLLSGMGVLHLEIAIKDLERDHRLDVTATEPTVVYRETIQHKVGPFMGKSPNKHNRVWFDIEPLEPAVVDLIRNGELSELSSRRQREEALKEKAGWSTRDSRRVVSVGLNANLLTDFTAGIQGLREVLQHVAGGFQWALEPVHRGPAQMMPAARQAMFAGILSAEPTLLEPIYKIQVRIPPGELGNVTGLLSRKRGSIHSVEQSGPAVTVTGMVPVSETLGLSQEMRAATSGSAFWQSTFDHWAPVPSTLLSETVEKVRTRKGMDPSPPHASRYIVRE
jgi:elongation factor 2